MSSSPPAEAGSLQDEMHHKSVRGAAVQSAAVRGAAVQGAVRHPLDNAVWRALTGPHAHLAQTVGQAVRYPVDVSPFVAVPDRPDENMWADLAALVGPGSVLALMAGGPSAPEGWERVEDVHLVQMLGDDLVATPDAETGALGAADVPEMLDLVARTQPGPFRPRTVELGGYLGVRRDGRLIAMAGQRLSLPGWTEISAVCTDSEFRGQGLASRLIRAVAVGIRAAGNTPFLHTAAGNTGAIRLYESMGFRLRRSWTMPLLRAPASAEPTP